MKRKRQNIQIKALTTTFEGRDKKKSRYFFSVYVVLKEDENKNHIPIIEQATSADEFKESIKTALSFHPEKIIVLDMKNKNELRDTATEYVFSDDDKEDAVKTEPKTDQLGIITEKYRHEGEMLRWKTDQQINEIKQQQKLDELQKKIDTLEEKLSEEEKLVKELEQANKEWEEEYEQLKENRFKLKGVEVTEILGNVLAKGVTGFIRQNSKGVSQLTGLPEQALMQAMNAPGQEEKEGSISENSQPEMEPVIAHLKEVLQMIDPQYLEPFIQINAHFARDNSLITKVNDDLKKMSV